ncbi:MAG: glycoside hydrolase family 32 protein [Chloroflexota bacterium]
MTTYSENPAIEKAMQSVAAVVPKAEADPTRPVYHFRPPANWMNDPNGTIYHNGVYQLFYQHNPYGDDWGHMHWGHARSTDLVNWEHLSIALWPSLELGEDHCFSGCAWVNGDGEPTLVYTMVGQDRENPEQRFRPFEQWAAVGSADWMTWQKHPQNPILSLDTHGGPPFEGGWRDPFIFEAGGRTLLVLGGSYDDTASVALYECTDGSLVNWTYKGSLFEQPRSELDFQECPNFAKTTNPDGEEKWVLLTSPFKPVHYVVGTFDAESLQFTPETQGILDPGISQFTKEDGSPGISPNFYATNILYDERCILLGWVRGFEPGMGWNGCMALPRELSVGADGHPRQTPIAELQQLRGETYRVEDIALSETPHMLDVSGDTLEIEATFEVGVGIGLQVRRSDDGSRCVAIHYDGAELDVAGTKVAFALDDGELLKLHVFIDKSVMEVFVNDGRACVTRILDKAYADTAVDDLGVAVVGQGTARATNLHCWRLSSIY